MAIILDKSCIQKDYSPRYGEVVNYGAREGIYLGKTRNPYQILVHWLDNGTNSIVPVSVLRFTGTVDSQFLEQNSGVSSPGHKGKGGLKTGGRRIKRTRVDIALKRQEIRRKKIGKGAEPGNAADEAKKFKNSVEKNSCVTGEKVICLGCGREIKNNPNSIEPFYCKPCQKRLGFIHITEGI